MTLSERPPRVRLQAGQLRELRDAIERLVEDGVKVEILGGEVRTLPTPTVQHDLIVSELQETFLLGLDRSRYRTSQRAEFAIDAWNSPQPDLAVVSRDLGSRPLTTTEYEASAALLVVEVTSPSNGNDDRKWGKKYKAYAKGMIPVYLLVDPHAAAGPSLTLFTKPTGTRYQVEEQVPFGAKLVLPPPFDQATIDSTSFPLTTKDGD